MRSDVCCVSLFEVDVNSGLGPREACIASELGAFRGISVPSSTAKNGTPTPGPNIAGIGIYVADVGALNNGGRKGGGGGGGHKDMFRARSSNDIAERTLGGGGGGRGIIEFCWT